MPDRWFYVEVNPVPWAVGPVTTFRGKTKMGARMGRNETVHAYKESIREALGAVEPLDADEYDLYFWFSRRLDEWVGTGGRKVKAHRADATNMQKATEDALQDLLIGNDCNVRRVGSEIVYQGEDVKGFVVIRARAYEGSDWDGFPDSILGSILAPPIQMVSSDNEWPPR